MKKKIIILMLAILILAILFSIYQIKNRELSKDEFISLMKNFEKISNVKIEGDTTTYIKDEYVLVIEKNDLCLWYNKNNKENIRYNPTLKQYVTMSYEETDYSEFANSTYTFIRI